MTTVRKRSSRLTAYAALMTGAACAMLAPAHAQTSLSAYMDANGFIDVQALKRLTDSF
jgi:hypothetical protein